MNRRRLFVLLVCFLFPSPFLLDAQVDLNLVQNIVNQVTSGIELPHIHPTIKSELDLARAKLWLRQDVVGNIIAATEKTKRFFTDIKNTLSDPIFAEEPRSSSANEAALSLDSAKKIFKAPELNPSAAAIPPPTPVKALVFSQTDPNTLNRISALEVLVRNLRLGSSRQNDRNADNVARVLNQTFINNFSVEGGSFASDVSVAGVLSLSGGTTTASKGIDLSGGCFAINGTCLSSGGGGSSNASTTLLADSNTFTGANIFNSITRSTSTSATTTNSFATTASSTNLYATSFTFGSGILNALSNLTSNGFVKTSGSNGALSVDTTSYTATTRALTINGTAGQITSSAGSQDLSADRTWTLSLPSFVQLTNLTLTNATITSATTTSATTTNIFSTVASTTNLFATSGNIGTLTVGTCTGCSSGTSLAPNSKFATSTGSFLSVTPNGGVNTGLGIGTTTPAWALQVASSTASQLTLSDPGVISNLHWSFRNAGGLLYLATSSATTFATSTTAALTINASGVVTLGSALISASSTLVTLTGSNATITQATTTNIFSTVASTTNLFATSGNIGNLTVGSCTGCSSGTSLAPNSKFATSTGSFLSVTPNGGVNTGLGIGTTTPAWALQVASSTASQLTLSDPGVISNLHWSFRNAGGLLYLATSSATTFATSTTAALTINASGVVTLGSALISASSTLVTLTGSNATITQATTTNIFSTVASTTNLFATSINTGVITSGAVNSQTISSVANFTGTVAITTSLTAPIHIGGSAAGSSLELRSTSGVGTTDFIKFTVGSNGAQEVARATNGGYFGIGTTTPQWALQISSSTASQLTLSDPVVATTLHWSFRNSSGNFYLATSSATTFATSTTAALTINANAFFGIGSTTPNERLSVNGNLFVSGNSTTSNFFATTASTTNLFATSLNTGNITAGVISTSLGTVSLPAHTFVGDTDTGFWSPAANTFAFSSGGAEVFRSGPGLYTGFGTTTPAWMLQLSSSTASQLTLSDPAVATTLHWSFRNAGGLFYLATSSATTYATSTTAALSINANGIVTLGGGATIGGNLTFSSVATTTIVSSANGWSIASSTAAGNGPIVAFHNISSTSTITFFSATSTGLVAGQGIGTAMKNAIIVGDGKTQASIAIVNGGICVDNDGWCNASTTGRVSAVTSTTGGSDLAEIYTSGEQLEPGDVVSSAGGLNITLATLSNERNLMGVVSTKPGVILGLETDESINEQGKFPIALSGRVPTKVNTENGSIEAGDYLTLSSVPGQATKAIKAGLVIGQALQGYSAEGAGKIDVFVKNTYYSGIDINKLAGILAQSALPTAKEILDALMAGKLTTAGSASNITTDRLIAGIEIITPKLTANIVEANVIKSPTIDLLSQRIETLENATSTSKNIFENISDWIGSKITAALGIFNRIEVGTARVSEGLELIDSGNGSVYCIRIKNGEWDKTPGDCSSTPSSPAPAPTPEPTPTPTLNTEPVTEVQITPEVATSTEVAP